MIVLGIDLETEWLDPINVNEIRAVEVGAVLYDMDKQQPLVMMNTLINQEVEIPQKLTDLTGITEPMIEKYGVSAFTAYQDLAELMGKAEFIIGHNANEFDYPILDAEFARNGVLMPNIAKIDSRVDVPYRKNITTRKLQYLCAEHGFANPFSHRAVFDVLSMMKLVCMYDFKEIVELSKQPTVTMIARVSFADKQLAKDAGFFWDGEHKYWFKKTKKAQAIREQDMYEFNVVIKEI